MAYPENAEVRRDLQDEAASEDEDKGEFSDSNRTKAIMHHREAVKKFKPLSLRYLVTKNAPLVYDIYNLSQL